MTTPLPPLADSPVGRHELRNVQALRALAALFVLSVHLSGPYVGSEQLILGQARWLSAFNDIGFIGVDLFFAISGFIMLVTSWELLGARNATRRFLLRRAIRIYPPYWFALVPAIFVHYVLNLHLMGDWTKGGSTDLLQTILLFPTGSEYFLLPVAWTLVFEMFFYVVFACLLGFPRRLLPIALGAWVCAEIVFFFAFGSTHRFFLSFLGRPLPLEFIGGACIGFAFVARRMPAARLVATAAVVLLGAVWAACIAMGQLPYKNDLERVVIFGIPAVLLVYSAVALENQALFVAPHWFARIGDSSYAIYLWHLNVLVAVRQAVIHLHPTGVSAHVVMLAVSIGGALVLGNLVFRYFERPVTLALNGFARPLLTAPRAIDVLSPGGKTPAPTP